MKFAIVLAVFIAVAAARPGSPDAEAVVKSQSSEIAPDHSSYSHAVETSNGIVAQETGQLRQPKSADESAAYETQGQFQWTGPDNVVYSVRYTAGVNGFVPEVSSNHFYFSDFVFFFAKQNHFLTKLKRYGLQ